MAVGTNYLANVISGILNVSCGKAVAPAIFGSSVTTMDDFTSVATGNNGVVSSADYFVDASRPDDSGDGLTLGTAKQTITAGIGLMSAGETVEVKGGSYTEDITTWVDGSVGAGYSVVRATAGEIPVVTGITAWSNNSYIDFDGFKIVHSNAINGLNASGISGGSNIRLFNTAYEGGPLSANTTTFGIGDDCLRSLIEDCWFYGPGGRANLSVYEGDQVTLRRVVIRHDPGWLNTVKPDPEGVGTVYQSSDVRLQNIIVIDSESNPANSPGSEWGGAFTQTNNSDTNELMTNNTVDGCIVLNVEGNAFEHGGGGGGGAGHIIDVKYNDVFCGWNNGTNKTGGCLSMNNPNDKVAYGERMVIDSYFQPQAMYNGAGGSINSLRNSIITNTINVVTGSPTGGVQVNEYNNGFNNNGENSSGAGFVSTDPSLNGLDYPVRIETGGALNTSGESGGQQGSTILKRIGVSGSVFGDADVDTVTTDDLWPWPNEARIKADMAAISTRGFCGGNSLDATPQTLTKYVWEYYGNQIPGDIY